MNGNKIKNEADKKIKEVGTTLANEQELFHGGKLIDTKENNKLTLSFPLSTTFDPVIANIEAMSNYTIKLLSDENLLAKMKKNAKEQALRFDLKNILPVYEKMYANTLEKFQK